MIGPQHQHEEDRDENRADCSLDGEHPAEALRRLGTGRLLPHRGTGGAGPRRDPVRERAVDHRGEARALLRAAAAAESHRARHHSLLHADARQGAQHGVRVRHPAFPHRPVPFPDLPRDGAPDRHDAARPPGSARSPQSLSRLSRDAAGLDLERATRSRSPTRTTSARSTTACRATSRRRSIRAAAIWPFSAASRRRSASTAPSPSPVPSACR